MSDSPFITEARKELARLEVKVEEGKEAQKLIPKIRALLNSAAPKKTEKRSRLDWYNKPAKCILPASFHERGANRDIFGAGLCSAHNYRLKKGKLTEEENEAYDQALIEQREKGNLR